MRLAMRLGRPLNHSPLPAPQGLSTGVLFLLYIPTPGHAAKSTTLIRCRHKASMKILVRRTRLAVFLLPGRSTFLPAEGPKHGLASRGRRGKFDCAIWLAGLLSSHAHMTL